MSSMSAPTAHILRSIARVAARNAFRRAQTADAQLLDEAKMTDRFTCTDAEMLVLLRVELARVQGQSRGGHVTAVRRKITKS
ncbi:hypothetical protein [Paracidovorax wautersii]|uniref:hypothetical protein n=1 Tax=Paracidovorax wautersii TaxID=1177982 RepID=UPI0011144F42|nr:hypothetical protein [Paracidovorax wautersii]